MRVKLNRLKNKAQRACLGPSLLASRMWVIFMVGPDHVGLLGPLQPMSPLSQGGMDGQELPVPHIIVCLCRGEPSGLKGDRVDVLVLLRPLGEDGPETYIRCVHLHDELARGLGKDEHRGRGEQALKDRECVLGLRGPGEGTEDRS